MSPASQGQVFLHVFITSILSVSIELPALGFLTASVHPGTVRVTYSSEFLSSYRGFGVSFRVFTVLTAFYRIYQSPSPYTVLAT